MRSIRLLFLLLFFPLWVCLAQKQVRVSIVPTFENKPLEFGHAYPFGKSDSVWVETFKFYLSALEFLKDDQSIWRETASFHLVDAGDEKTMHLGLNASPELGFNRIRFTLGIDSLTQVSGAMGGDLDPTKGMYWTWDNGYINTKIEGKSTLCATRNREFQLHLGGYRSDVNTSRTVTLPVKPAAEIQLLVDLKTVLSEVDLAKTHHIMSAGKEAVRISSLLTKNLKTNSR